MKLSIVVATFAAVASAVLSATGHAAGPTNNWTYRSNAAGMPHPAQWGATFPICAGQRQSPIDIPAQTLPSLRRHVPLLFGGSCPQFNVTLEYDAFKAAVASGGACKVTRSGKVFNFARVHFHTPSEHTVNGRPLDGEAQFVHTSTDGSAVVVGLFLQRTGAAASDPFVAQFARSIQGVTSTRSTIANLGSFHMAVRQNLMSGRAFNYPGSLTTPGCSEIVDWWVVERPLSVSAADFAAIRTHFARIASSDNGNNARPTQPLNGRTVTVY